MNKEEALETIHRLEKKTDGLAKAAKAGEEVFHEFALTRKGWTTLGENIKRIGGDDERQEVDKERRRAHKRIRYKAIIGRYPPEIVQVLSSTDAEAYWYQLLVQDIRELRHLHVNRGKLFPDLDRPVVEKLLEGLTPEELANPKKIGYIANLWTKQQVPFGGQANEKREFFETYPGYPRRAKTKRQKSQSAESASSWEALGRGAVKEVQGAFIAAQVLKMVLGGGNR